MRRTTAFSLVLLALLLVVAAPATAAKGNGTVKYSAPYQSERAFDVGQCPATDLRVSCDVRYEADAETGEVSFEHRLSRLGGLNPTPATATADTASLVLMTYTPTRDLDTLTVTAEVLVDAITDLPAGASSSASVSLDVRDYVTEPCCDGASDTEEIFTVTAPAGPAGASTTVQQRQVTLTAELWNAKAGVPLQIAVGLYGVTRSPGGDIGLTSSGSVGESVNMAIADVLRVSVTPGR